MRTRSESINSIPTGHVTARCESEHGKYRCSRLEHCNRVAATGPTSSELKIRRRWWWMLFVVVERAAVRLRRWLLLDRVTCVSNELLNDNKG